MGGLVTEGKKDNYFEIKGKKVWMGLGKFIEYIWNKRLFIVLFDQFYREIKNRDYYVSTEEGVGMVFIKYNFKRKQKVLRVDDQ